MKGKKKLVIKANDIYIVTIFIFIVVAFFAKTTSIFTLFGHITVLPAQNLYTY